MKIDTFKRATYIAISAIMFFGLTSNAQQKVKKHKEYKREVCKKDRGGLNLTEDQKTKIKAIKLSFKNDVLPLRNELGEKKARLRTLTSLKKTDKKAVYKVIDAMASIKAKIAKREFESTEAVKEILTDEQKTIFLTNKGHRRFGKFAKHNKRRKHKGHYGRKGKRGNHKHGKRHGENHKSKSYNELDINDGVEYGDIFYDNNIMIED